MPSSAVARSLSSTLDASAVLRRPHKDRDHTAMIAVIRWCLRAGAYRAGEVVGAVVISCLPFGRHCWRSTERGCRVACALIGDSCGTWLALRWVTGGVAAATRSVVAPRNKT